MSPRGSVIPMRGHAPPELAPPGDDAARPARGRRRSTSELGGRGRAVASLTTRRKVSRSRGDSGKDRPRHDASAARVHAAEILIRAQRPPAAPSVNISLRVLAYGAVSATGWSPHRCSECFGSVKLRRRSIKSALKSWKKWHSTSRRF